MYGFYKATLVSGLVAACSVLLSTAITAEPRSTPEKGPNNSVVLPTNAKGILAQCGDYYTFSPDSSYYGVIPEDYSKNSIPVPPMITPVYGYMVGKDFPVDEALQVKQGENPYNIAEINRALWEGHSFIWMSTKTQPETFEYIQNFANKWNLTHENKVIPLTWTGSITIPEKTLLPANREFAFSSWNISQSCMSFSDAAFEEFMEQSIQHNLARETTPVPTAKVDETGSLPSAYPSTPPE